MAIVRKEVKRNRNKKGDLNISFGMIFSIILIIVFLGFAFYAIQKFLSFQEEVQEAKFYESLKIDIERVWTSTEASKEVEYIVPGNVKQVCFKDNSIENVYFYTDRPKSGTYLEHLSITGTQCISVVGGKVSFILNKEFGEALVSIEEK